jgi:hypothetical protein
VGTENVDMMGFLCDSEATRAAIGSVDERNLMHSFSTD